MSEFNENCNESSFGCPITKMTFGEVTRYLQNGNEKPIQKTLVGHVAACRSCQEALAKVEALRKAGRNIMHNQFQEFGWLNHQETQSQKKLHLTEAQLASFLDDGLTKTERKSVTKHLAECYECYKQFMVLEKESMSTTTETMKTPTEILEIMSEKMDTPLEQIKSRLQGFWAQLLGYGRLLWNLRWPVPALIYVSGIFLMLLVTSDLNKRTNFVVILPAIITESETEKGHVLNDLPMEKSDDIQTHTIQVEIPYSASSKITFRWPIVQGCIKYRVEFYNASDKLILKKQGISQNTLTIASTYFYPGKVYMILVKGIFQRGGIGAVSKMRFRIEGYNKLK